LIKVSALFRLLTARIGGTVLRAIGRDLLGTVPPAV